MWKFASLIIVILSFDAGAFAQANVPSGCASVSVSGRAGITNPGEIAIFTAEISGNTPPNVVYVWTVSEGEIVGGQNTLSVRVRYPKTEASNLTAPL